MSATVTETRTGNVYELDKTCEHSEHHARRDWHADGDEQYALVLYPCCNREPEPIILCGKYQQTTIHGKWWLKCAYCGSKSKSEETYIWLGPVRS